jgi:hypothetical protein
VLNVGRVRVACSRHCLDTGCLAGP